MELRDIRVSFGGVHAVDGVTIDMYPGEVVALVGGNGAGKSTLIHTLAGAHPADAGRSSSTARRSPSRTRETPVRRGRSDLPEARVADNLDAAGEHVARPRTAHPVRFLDDSAMLSATQKLMARLNPRFKNLRTAVSSLSGGQRQSVAIGEGSALQRQDPHHGRAHGGARTRPKPPRCASWSCS